MTSLGGSEANRSAPSTDGTYGTHGTYVRQLPSDASVVVFEGVCSCSPPNS
jgi:hypothetical protein